MTELDWTRLWETAIPWDRYLSPTMDLSTLRTGVFRQAKAPAWAVEQLAAMGPVRLVLLTHDWCWDEANSGPWIARLVEAVPSAELRVLLRDEHPDVMDRFLTDGTRSIPIVIGLAPDGRVLGHYGPRPAPLQAWVKANKATMPKDQRYAEMRRWYLKDRGESTLRGVLAAMSSL